MTDSLILGVMAGIGGMLQPYLIPPFVRWLRDHTPPFAFKDALFFEYKLELSLPWSHKSRQQ